MQSFKLNCENSLIYLLKIFRSQQCEESSPISQPIRIITESTITG